MIDTYTEGPDERRYFQLEIARYWLTASEWEEKFGEEWQAIVDRRKA